MAKLYTEAELRSAMEVGIGLGCKQHGSEYAPPPPGTPTARVVDEAMSMFCDGHGHEVPNYDALRGLMERGDWRGLARAHLAAAEMTEGQASFRHVAIGRLAAMLEVDQALQDVSHGIERCAGRA